MVELFGRYILLERIGTGGMAEVHRALMLGEKGFARTVAVKRILPHLAEDASVTTMLIDEARLAATLDHPNIIRVLDLGRQGDSYFLAMEYVSGRTLTHVFKALLARGARLPVRLLVHLGRLAVGALEYAHTRTDPEGRPMDIIHRDVSPDNIMVGYDGRVFLMDFGIARAADRARLTLAGSLKGKPAYMSPEVVRGEPISQALDLYAMGVVLHESASLQPMRLPKSDVQMLMDVSKGGFPTFESMGVDVPGPLKDVIYRALHDQASQRFQSAAAFGAALLEAERALGGPATTAEMAEFLNGLFAQDVAAEAAITARWHRFARKVQGKKPRAVARLVAQENGQKTTPGWVWPMVAGGTVAAAAALLAWQGGLTRAGGLEGTAAVGGVTAGPVLVPVVVDAGPQARRVRVVTQPPGARVMVDGQDRGTTPLDVWVEPSGRPVLRFTLAGHQAHEQALAYQDGQDTVQVRLEPAAATPPPRPKVGELNLQTRPWGKVFIDGKDTGLFTPLSGHKLAAGVHAVEVVNDQLQVKASFQVKVPPGGQVTESRALQ